MKYLLTAFLACLVVGADSGLADDAVKMRVMETTSGTRFGLFGNKPQSPAATFFVFATSVDEMARTSIYTETGRLLARHGWLFVTLDPPCLLEPAGTGPAGRFDDRLLRASALRLLLRRQPLYRRGRRIVPVSLEIRVAPRGAGNR